MSHYSDDRRRREDHPRAPPEMGVAGLHRPGRLAEGDQPPLGGGRRETAPAGSGDSAAAAAAAAAARISAMVGLKPKVETTAVVKLDEATISANAAEIEDGEFTQDIEINDLRNRYLLTKSLTQHEIKTATGAVVVTRGKYYPDKAMATEREPPLYLHVSSNSIETLKQAVQMINELIEKDLGSLVDERRFRKREDFERDEYGRRKWPEEKITIGVESLRGFNVRAQVVGPQGSFVKYISSETKTRVQIKGQNSGYHEPATGRESDEPLHVHVVGPEINDVKRAADMVRDLVETVRENYEAHRSHPPGDVQSAIRLSGYGSGDPPTNQPYHPYPQSGGAPAGPPGTVSTAGPPGQPYNAQDPYAAYGGYDNYVAYYNAYYQQQQQLQQPGDHEQAPATAEYSQTYGQAYGYTGPS